MIAGLPEKTGKSLDEWLHILGSSKLSKHNEFVTLLKSEHGITHGFANMIALQALIPIATRPATLMHSWRVSMRAPSRHAGLIYDAVLAAVRKFGSDVEVSPKKPTSA